MFARFEARIAAVTGAEGRLFFVDEGLISPPSVYCCCCCCLSLSLSDCATSLLVERTSSIFKSLKVVPLGCFCGLSYSGDSSQSCSVIWKDLRRLAVDISMGFKSVFVAEREVICLGIFFGVYRGGFELFVYWVVD